MLCIPEGVNPELIEELKRLQDQIRVLIDNHKVDRLLCESMLKTIIYISFQILTRRAGENPEVRTPDTEFILESSATFMMLLLLFAG
jgi:hypothetical protein